MSSVLAVIVVGFDSFFFLSSPLFSGFFFLFLFSYSWDGIRYGMGFEVFYSRWRADELKFEKVGGRGYIYFKRG